MEDHCFAFNIQIIMYYLCFIFSGRKTIQDITFAGTCILYTLGVMMEKQFAQGFIHGVCLIFKISLFRKRKFPFFLALTIYVVTFYRSSDKSSS